MSAATERTPIAWADPARQQAFDAWLQSVAPAHGLDVTTVRSASADASFRRYFRVQGAQGSFIVMDAPPQHEDCRPFVKVAHLLTQGGVAAPAVLAWDEPQGFMLLADLGSSTLLSTLVPDAAPWSTDDKANRARYQAATDELIRLQCIPGQAQVPPYDDALLQRELDLLPDWYLTQLRGMTLTEAQQTTLQRSFALIKAQVLSQPAVLVHRDYHSRNLMANPADPSARLGVIDFQDAVWGPVTYDLVSLLRDAYVTWDEERQIDIAIRYWEQARKAGLPMRDDFGDFWRDVEWMGLQRHLKVLGIFARLCHRDGKPGYLKDCPRVMGYAQAVARRYVDLAPLAALLDRIEGVEHRVGHTF